MCGINHFHFYSYFVIGYQIINGYLLQYNLYKKNKFLFSKNEHEHTYIWLMIFYFLLNLSATAFYKDLEIIPRLKR